MPRPGEVEFTFSVKVDGHQTVGQLGHVLESSLTPIGWELKDPTGTYRHVGRGPLLDLALLDYLSKLLGNDGLRFFESDHHDDDRGETEGRGQPVRDAIS